MNLPFDLLEETVNSVDAAAKAWSAGPRRYLRIRWLSNEFVADAIDDTAGTRVVGRGPDLLTAIARALGIEEP